MHKPEKLNVSETERAALHVGGVCASSVQLMESVKPMDTIELQFEEHLTTVTTTTTRSSLEEQVTIEHVEPLSRAKLSRGPMADEKCAEFFVYPSVDEEKAVQRQVIDDLQPAEFVHKRNVDKIGFGEFLN